MYSKKLPRQPKSLEEMNGSNRQCKHFTDKENKELLRLYIIHGNKWIKISKKLPSRNKKFPKRVGWVIQQRLEILNENEKKLTQNEERVNYFKLNQLKKPQTDIHPIYPYTNDLGYCSFVSNQQYLMTQFKQTSEYMQEDVNEEYCRGYRDYRSYGDCRDYKSYGDYGDYGYYKYYDNSNDNMNYQEQKEVKEMEDEMITSFPSVHNRPLDNIRQEPIFRPCPKESYKVIESKEECPQGYTFQQLQNTQINQINNSNDMEIVEEVQVTSKEKELLSQCQTFNDIKQDLDENTKGINSFFKSNS